eukprot:TRINITY_DN1323_c0_g1_i1.p1 TRINITY_DN1323_c0_g1~~TRINITY_DN1323_c0_g1_i1.p1  ORF type:complete len:122 (-),score=16.32 TRINITY_DN1323_c0_g1_i1:190-555(-)
MFTVRPCVLLQNFNLVPKAHISRWGQLSKKDTKMAVMFIRDVPGVAEEGEEKKVAKGYARNYLFPRDLAVYATPAIREKYAQMGIVCCFLSEFNLQRVQKNGSYGSRWLNPDKGLAKLHWK